MKTFLLLAFAGSIVAAPQDTLPDDSRPIQSPPVGRLLLREVYDLNGKRIALEEYTDAKAARATSPSPASTATKTSAEGCEKCGKWCDCGDGCRCTSTAWAANCGAVPRRAMSGARGVATVQSPIPAPLTYYGGPIQNSPFGTTGTTAPNVAPLSMSWPGSMQMAPTRMYAQPVMQAGDTNGGG